MLLDAKIVAAYRRGMDIRSHLRLKGLTQRDVARQLQVSDANVSKWLDRKTPVPVRVLRPMAEYIGVEVDALLVALEPRE